MSMKFKMITGGYKDFCRLLEEAYADGWCVHLNCVFCCDFEMNALLQRCEPEAKELNRHDLADALQREVTLGGSE